MGLPHPMNLLIDVLFMASAVFFLAASLLRLLTHL